MMMLLGTGLSSSDCPFEVTAWSQWFGEKSSSDASYVDGTPAFLKGGPLKYLVVAKNSNSGCITGVRATHIGKTTTELGLAWPIKQPGPPERTSSILQLAGNEIIQKAEVWLKAHPSAFQHRCITAIRFSMNSTRQWTAGKLTSDPPLVAVANRKAGFLAAIRGFEFSSTSNSFGTYLPALQFVWAAPSPGCLVITSEPTVTDVPYMQKVAPVNQTCPGNLLINGGFEIPKLEDVIAFPDPEKVPGFGWSFKDCPQPIPRPLAYGPDLYTEIQREDHPFTILPYWNPDGANRYELATDYPMNICQVVETKPGGRYQLCFLHRKRTDTGPAQNTVTTVQAGEPGKKLQELLKISIPAGVQDTWRHHCVSFTATATTLRLAIGDQSIDNFPGCGTLLDAVCLKPMA